MSARTLDDAPFSYAASRGGVVSIRFRGRTVTTLRGTAAARFLARVEGADAAAAQLAMAKATGNFERGNERRGGTAGIDSALRCRSGGFPFVAGVTHRSTTPRSHRRRP